MSAGSTKKFTPITFMAMRSIGRSLARRKFLWLIFLFYLLAVSASVYCLVLKRDALKFQTRDYPYFIEQAAWGQCASFLQVSAYILYSASGFCLVWDFVKRAALDPYQTNLLLDYNTYCPGHRLQPELCYSSVSLTSVLVSTPGMETNL